MRPGAGVRVIRPAGLHAGGDGVACYSCRPPGRQPPADFHATLTCMSPHRGIQYLRFLALKAGREAAAE